MDTIQEIIKSIETDIDEMKEPILYPSDQFYAGAVMYAEYILSVLQSLNIKK